MYKDEAMNHDKTLLVKWNKTLDILLIFVSTHTTNAALAMVDRVDRPVSSRRSQPRS